MERHLENIVLYLAVIVIFFLCMGEYFGVSGSIMDIDAEIVKALPFGGLMWEIYLSCFFSDQSAIHQILSGTFLKNAIDVTSEVTSLICTYFIYQLIIKKPASALMLVYTAGTDDFFDRLKASTIYNICFALSAVCGKYVVAIVSQQFTELGLHYSGAEIVQLLSYWIFNVGSILIIIIIGKKILNEVIKTLAESIAKLIATGCFFLLIHYVGMTKTISLEIILILIAGVAVSLVTEKN